MTNKLYDILRHRYETRDSDKQWVFWHTYWSRKSKKMVNGTYGDRKRLMKCLCEKANVKYFRYHPLRHFTASILADQGVPPTVIQEILGHKNLKTTLGYIHSVGEAAKMAMATLDEVDFFSYPSMQNENQPTNMHPEYWIRKVDRPDYESLCNDIDKLGYVGSGKKYGVSDNAIRKW